MAPFNRRMQEKEVRELDKYMFHPSRKKVWEPEEEWSREESELERRNLAQGIFITEAED